VGQGIQTGAKGAADSFNRFVEGSADDHRSRSKTEPERKDFWDSFGEPEEPISKPKPSSIGTAAMKKGGGGGGYGGTGSTGGGGKGKDDKDDWGERW
jgi:ADP-ribosylation factor GTPase-activating protein 1